MEQRTTTGMGRDREGTDLVPGADEGLHDEEDEVVRVRPPDALPGNRDVRLRHVVVSYHDARSPARVPKFQRCRKEASGRKGGRGWGAREAGMKGGGSVQLVAEASKVLLGEFVQLLVVHVARGHQHHPRRLRAASAHGSHVGNARAAAAAAFRREGRRTV
jgi:hypothetical protein